MAYDKTMPTSELLELYPEFKPLWQACGDNKNLKYHIRKVLLEHHDEMTE